MSRAWVLLLLAGCDHVFGTSPPTSWSVPVVDPGFPATGADDPTLTANLLELYYNFEDDIWVAERTSIDAPWSGHRVVAELSSPAEETTPEVSGDGRTIVWSSAGTGSSGATDLVIAKRAEGSSQWSEIRFLTSLSSSGFDWSPALTMDELEIVFTSTRTEERVWTSTRRDLFAEWDMPVPLASLNTIVRAGGPFITADGLAVCFHNDPDTGSADLYFATRESRDEPFSTPVPIEEINTTDAEENCWLSPDGSHIYFIRHTASSSALMHATR